jgi:type III pantothenate kinase
VNRINCINNLVIDVGNTLTKIGVFEGNNLIFSSKYSSLSTHDISSIINSHCINRAILSRVGEFSTDFEEIISQKVPLVIFGTSTPIPIKNCYKTPTTLGVDRLAAAIAGNFLYPNRNVLVVDSGSALTYEIVTSKGEYLGGAISPGIEMRFKALNQFTSKLPLISFNNSFPLIGSNTETSIISGVINGILSEVDAYIYAIKAQFSDLEVVFTGGDAFFFDKKLKNSIFVHPNLVLIGLNRILEYNEN